MDRLIRRRFGKHIPQSFIEKAIRTGNVLVNGQKTSSSAKVSDDCSVYVNESLFNRFKEDEQKRQYSGDSEFKKMIIYEDENLIVINKPAGLAVQLGSKTTESIDTMAKSYNQEARLVHRIDKETSGITILAKNLKTSRYMTLLFKNKQIHKGYMAIVSGSNLREKGTINVPLAKEKESVVVDKINGKETITEYTVQKRLNNGLALIAAYPKTGRTHQIRVHLKHIGCPILGDKKYSGRSFKKLCLHAHKVSFVDIKGKNVKITAPLPEYMSLL
ncbi:MAG: RluA family pseudouridine synthase [Holosporales bacterium]|nr:RluA family pseudouridine synthase [Holosporales bacterium]